MKIPCPNCNHQSSTPVEHNQHLNGYECLFNLADFDLINCSWHESGHYVIAQHLALSPQLVIDYVADNSGIYEKAFKGQILYQNHDIDRHDMSILGWAGFIAERMKHELADEDVDFYVEELMEYFHSLGEAASAADLAAINSVSEVELETTFRECWTILQAKFDLLEETASDCINHGMNQHPLLKKGCLTNPCARLISQRACSIPLEKANLY